MGIQICSNKGAGFFWGPIRDKIRNILIDLLLMNHWLECIYIFMEHPWGKEIQVCANEVPGVTNGHALRGHSFI